MRTGILLLLAAAAFAASTDSPTGSRTTPPIITSLSQLGVSRGTTVELEVEGMNLAKASAIYFSEPGVKGRIVRVKELPDLPEVRLGSNGTASTIDLGPLPPRNRVTVELDVDADAEIGPVDFRLQTPLGTSPVGRFLIEPYYGEAADREPNDTPDEGFETYLPAILAGTISRPGDVDYYKIKVKAGEELMFEDSGPMVLSALQPVVQIVSGDLAVVREVTAIDTPIRFGHKFDKAGTYYVRVADYQQGGGGKHVYRIKVGSFPLAVAAYPLGVEKGRTREVSLTGLQVTGAKVKVLGQASPDDEDAVIFRPETAGGKSFAPLRLALGTEPEVEASGTNLTKAQAQPIRFPVTVNGRLGAKGESHFYRVHARKGESLVFEVNARRLGSELDSVLEVLDADGKPIERGVARAVWQTSTTLSERDSASRAIRIQSWDSLAVGDYVMAGGEVMRLEALPRTPDDDIVVESFGGQRITFFDTTPEAHAVDEAVYKVQIAGAGAKFSPNGLPLVRLYFRNDDGGPGYSKDSLVHFTAPADGDYLVRLADVRGQGGEQFTYRLTARAPRPDFRLSVNPRNPNVPAGGAVPVTATAFRMDGFEGPIEVSLEGLPAGLQAEKCTIGAGQVSTTLLLRAAPQAQLEQAVPLRVMGRGESAGVQLAHRASPEDKLKLIALMPKPDVVMTADTRVVEVEAGGTAEVSLHIQRQNDFAGRVPVDVRNLPPRVRVLNVGLNGVLINEDETRRSFKIEALASAEPIEQLIYVAGAVETRSTLPATYAAPEPILLRVKPRAARASR
ncbi:MAG: hypothetical protein NTY38_16900 [Acidobacteria bacterium]|nr:hypothetical protein [Acidobacteriota bacterium]